MFLNYQCYNYIHGPGMHKMVVVLWCRLMLISATQYPLAMALRVCCAAVLRRLKAE